MEESNIETHNAILTKYSQSVYSQSVRHSVSIDLIYAAD